MATEDTRSFAVGDWLVQPDINRISTATESVYLRRQVMEVLVYLAGLQGKAASLEAIHDDLWCGKIVSSGTVYNCIAELRQALSRDGREVGYIETIPKKGYRLAPGVMAVPVLPASDQGAVPAANLPLANRIAICVLPFANMSGDPEQEYFSDGITEDIITELSRWRFLAVRSRSASFQYRGVAVDLKQVARELDVQFVVEGSVRRMGERIRISAQVIDTETGSHVWAEKFDRALADIFAVQDLVVRTIVSTLVGRVQVFDVERARRKPPAILAAYEYVLRGNALPWSDPAGAAEATRLFEKAIEIDPGYGFAYALLASMRFGRWYEDHDPTHSDAALHEAHALAQQSIKLDENESTCFSILAQVCLLLRSFDLAMQYARRAIELNPGNQWNTADMGLFLIHEGRPEEALKWFKRAKEIDPYFDPPWYWRSIGHAYMHLHRYDEALAMLSGVPARGYRVAALMAACHARLGDTKRALESATECVAMKPDFSTRQFMTKEPFKNPADAAHLADSLLMAGLPD